MVEGSGTPGFVELYQAAAPALYAWASLRIRPTLRRRLDPEDLVQEVCCRAFERRAHYDPERGPFRAWLFGIAHNVLKKAIENLARGPTQASFVLSDASRQIMASIPGEATSVASRVARSDEVKRLLEQAEELPERDQKLLVLRGLMGMRHPEIATRLDISVSVAEKSWQRLRDRLAATGAAPSFLQT